VLGASGGAPPTRPADSGGRRLPVCLSVRPSDDFHTELPALKETQTCRVVCVTWNVNQQKPEHSSVFRLLRRKAEAAHVVVVGLQVGGSWPEACGRPRPRRLLLPVCLSGGGVHRSSARVLSACVPSLAVVFMRLATCDPRSMRPVPAQSLS
jgi:hypothetical protein